ncbi:MAG: AAA family ATPase [Bacteroidota bacterium]|nr:AAA family ATPase [Bacteroidota bacterium]
MLSRSLHHHFQLQKKLNIINKSRERYKNLYERVEIISKEYSLISDITNNYDTYYNELVTGIETLFKNFQEKDYTVDKESLKKLQEDILKQEKVIEKYLKDKGLSEENIQDAKNASQKLISLKSERENKVCELRTIRKDIRLFNTNNIDTNIEEFGFLIDKEIERINEIFREIFEKNPSEVKLIEVKYEPSNDIYQRVFNELESVLDIRHKISSFKSTFWDYLKSISIDEVLLLSSGEALIKKIGERNTQAYKAIEQIFLDKTNFQIYKLLIEKEKRNISDNKILRVYYDNKPLDNSSFGQKCTAAIVILLSLGNNPIIIDEPEAHLDSSLIANYLVNLVKKQKKQRQIVFATHNANFVLNADAELIIKLENNDGTTLVTNFTIENLSYREDLLKLEGGREAFKKREMKYNI